MDRREWLTGRGRKPKQGGEPKREGVFVFREKPAAALSPKQFGQAAVQWSVDQANELLNRVLGIPPDQDGVSLVGRIRSDPSKARLQFQALLVATYFAYARGTLRLPNSVLEKVAAGVKDGIGHLKSPSGEPLGKEDRSLMEGCISRYTNAITADIMFAGSTPDAKEPKGNQAFQTASDLLSTVYSADPTQPDEFSSLELAALQHVIDHFPVSVIGTLKNDLGVTYRG